MPRAASSVLGTTAVLVLIALAGGPDRLRSSSFGASAVALAEAEGPPLRTAHVHAQEAALPPLSYTCPHHPDVIEPRAGACPLCKLALEPVRLDSSWMCPIHSAVQESSSGNCRICKRALVRVTVALTWSCRGEADHLEPGRCKDGTPRMAARTLRPHGNHNPQRGGQFFMAPDNWHHLEGTYPRDRLFRLYVYDDYARALDADGMRTVQGRVVTRETFDPATRQTRELTSFPLRLSSDGGALEARVNGMTMPAEMTAKVRFAPGGPEYRFDFTFSSLTPADAGGAAPAAARPTTVARSARAAGPAPAAAPIPDPLAPLPAAESMGEMVAQLRTRLAQVTLLVERRDYASVWVPAFGAKEVAVALEPHVAHLATASQRSAEGALREIVRTAWQLDAVGDAGNRLDVEAAHAEFTAAVVSALAAFGETR
jgi:hypothetical protein